MHLISASKFDRSKYERRYHEIKELVQAAIDGDSDSFVKLMQNNELIMYKIACGYFRCDADIADALQETVLDCFESIGKLRKPESFKTWMIRILINNCNAMKRKSSRYTLYEIPPETGLPDTSESNIEFKMMLESINEPDRTILMLYYDQQLSIREICHCMSMSKDAVKSRLKRGRAKAKDIYMFEKKEAQS